MRALLLGAGLGTRLRPITTSTPKCLVSIHGKPLLEIWLERLCAVGVTNFLINTHYLSDQVVDFICTSKYHKMVILTHEETLLGTAGTLLKNIDFYQEECGYLIHADNYCLANFYEFEAVHNLRPPGCEITMMTFRTAEPANCGIVEINNAGIVKDFYEKDPNPPGNLANGAIYLLTSEFIKNYSQQFHQAKDFSVDVLPALINKIYTYETKEVLIDIGTPDAYNRAIHSL